ncbi:MAG: methyl-accepting chemotaxis protein [Shewanella sp.]
MEALLRGLSIKTRLFSLLSVLLVIMIALGIYQRESVGTVNNMLHNMFKNQLQPIAELSNANIQAIYHNRSLYDLIIEAEQANMLAIAETMKDYDAKMQQQLDLYRKTSMSDEEIKLLKEFEASWGVYVKSAAEVEAASIKGDNALAMSIMQGATAAFDTANNLLTALVTLNMDLAKVAYVDSDVLVDNITNTLILVIAAVVVVVVFAGWQVAFSICRPLAAIVADLNALAQGDLQSNAKNEGNDEITSMQQAMASTRGRLRDVVQNIKQASNELSHCGDKLVVAGEQVMASSKEQASATTTSAAALEQMAASISHLADSAKGANRLAVESSKVAQSGELQVEKVSSEVANVSIAINDSSQDLRKLTENIQQVSKISVMIKGVAEQTNLLALNAAIEAARAGEQGRGFAVVADEVRNLAARTSNATHEIDQMIGTVQQAADSTVANMNAYLQTIESVKTNASLASTMMAQVDKGSQDVVHLMSDITQMLNEQSSASNEVAKSVESVNTMSKQNVAASDNVNREAMRLTEIVRELNNGTNFFKL